MSITIEEMQKRVHKLAKEKGWWPIRNIPFTDTPVDIDREEVNIPEKLMLMVSELGEALEHYRGPDGITTWFVDRNDGIKKLYKDFAAVDIANKPDGFWIELADCIIRILDLAGAYNINMEELIKEKHEYNKTRPFKHGGKKC
jgi:NTP pyrophosphatase (non-canonical NTP hydrolase)